MMTEEKSEYPIKIVEVFHQTDAAGNEVVTAVTVDSLDPENPDNIPLWHITSKTTTQ